MSEQLFYECQYCQKKLLKKSAYDQHMCRQKERHLFVKTPAGKSAYELYVYWRNINGRSTVSVDTFIASRYYTSFNKFQKFVKNVGLPEPKMYIEFVNAKGLLPNTWLNIELYDAYVDYFDNTISPSKLAELTLKTIYTLANIFECEISEVFDNLEVHEVAQLINERKLSPWILLNAKSFIKFLNRISKDKQDVILLNSVLDSETWYNKFSKDPKSVNKMRQVCKEIGL